MMPMASRRPPMSWGGSHQVCKSHVKRNTQALIQELRPLVAKDSDGSLQTIGVEAAQAVADLDRLGELISSRQPEQGKEVEGLHRRYLLAPPPKKGAVASLAYRLRLLYLDRSPLWSRLTRYRKWRGPHDEQLDGTNNACERAIGWWIKERYRSMRGDIGSCQCPTRQSSSRLVRQLPQQWWSQPGHAPSVSEGKQGDTWLFSPIPSCTIL
jgi:hypothetical protein